MPKDESIKMDGVVLEALPNAQFRVQLAEQEHVILAYLTGNMRRNFVRVLPGDTVELEISPYDLTKGRITYRK